MLNDDILASSFGPPQVLTTDQVRIRASMQKNLTTLDGNASIFRVDAHHRHIGPEFSSVIH
jgi:hypothetical protein